MILSPSSLLAATATTSRLLFLLMSSSSTPGAHAAASIFFDPMAIRHSCLNADDGTTLPPGMPVHLTDVDTSQGDVTLLLDPMISPPSSSGDGSSVTSMCVLHRWTLPLEDKNEKRGYYFPLGRSSSRIPGDLPLLLEDNSTASSPPDVALGDWTRPPGRASRSLEYVCGTASNSGSNFDAGEYLCEVTLPATMGRNHADPTVNDHLDLPYYMTYHERNVAVRDELSRFLQKNTFGPTVDNLDDMEAKFSNLKTAGGLSHDEAMAKVQLDWVVDQMDPTTFAAGEYSSLRKYWRKRLNPRREETYRIGEAGPHPCETNSRWRKFAFTAYDVQNAKALRWGNLQIGGTYQTQKGHKVTIETVVMKGLVGGNVTSGTSTTSSSLRRNRALQGADTAAPVPAPVAVANPISSEPTMTNLLVMGDMEGSKIQVLNQFLGTCSRTVMNVTENPNLVYSGMSSLKFLGGRTCFFFRPIAPSCGTARMAEPVRAGDTFKVSLKVRVEADDQVFQMYTGHYHASKGDLKWTLPEDDSHMISRTRIVRKNEWVTVEAIHKVGDDWTYKEGLLVPELCNQYHLRFRMADSGASFYLDDVRMTKVGVSTPSDLSVPGSGFFANPNFEYSFQYWMYSSAAPTLVKDSELNRDVMVMTPGSILTQNVLSRVVPGKSYRFGMLSKIPENSTADNVDLIVMLRLKFNNNDLVNGPCNKPVCNLYERALTRNIKRADGGWQEVVTDQFTMFGNFTEWDGSAEFLLVHVTTPQNSNTSFELMIAGFQDLGDDYTMAPSMSMMPSTSPTTLVQDHIAYVVRYAGEVRTVINYPFQIDLTGEVLPMNGSKAYELCEADEVEGGKVQSPNGLGFLIGKVCKSIRHGNPTVNLDPNFINMTDLHLLDLSNTLDKTVTPINTNQTLGSDWLLTTPVEDEVCATFPSPYDNDYRGGDPNNPDETPSRFNPDKPVFAKLPDDTYALFDSRLIVNENTLENPLMDGGGSSVLRSSLRADKLGVAKNPYSEGYTVFNEDNIALCSNEQPNFLNEDNCVLSYEENVCVKEYVTSTGTNKDTQLVITFDDATLAKLHNTSLASNTTETARYIYALDNLLWDDSILGSNITKLPCAPGNPVSRWVPHPDLSAADCTNSLASKSKAALMHALESSNDENPYLRDIYLWNDLEEDGCDPVDYAKYGMLVMTEKEGCWENVHPDLLSIYDFTGYEFIHPASTTGITHINSWASIGIMQYPDNHPASYFEELKARYNTITPVERYSYASTWRVNQGARYGDSLLLDYFANQTHLNANPDVLKVMANDLGKLTLANNVHSNRGGGTLVCGSPNEVAPDPTLDDYFDVMHRDNDCIGCMDSYGDYATQKVTVWAMNALEGEDQLCQRMAWSLYEHLNVGAASNADNTESNLYTYDIMIRHCFGSYFDILKEMTYSPKTAEQFSFAESTSTRIAWDTSGELVFPDENYAREIMQLFTIGLHELNPDGTKMLDEFGRVIKTYTNVDILSNARLLSGFTFTARRGNVEELERSEKSRQDPLRIEVDRHDFFPKISIDGGWIGDRYPLCVDLPKYHFLKMGAKFVFRGDSSLPRKHYNPVHWDSDESIRRFVLSPDSGLHQALCNKGSDGSCNFASTVTLDSNLACHGQECRVDDVVIVQVQAGAFYEYIRQPCVDLSFYDNPKKVITGYSPWVRRVGRRHTHAMCANPRSAVAARSCCNLKIANQAEYNHGFEYHGERVYLETNVNQCTAHGGAVCDPNEMVANNPLVNTRPVYSYPYPSQNTFFWTNSSCTQAVKVREDGMIAIVNFPAENPLFMVDTIPYVDSINAATFFSAYWEKDPVTSAEIYPSLNNTCGNGACAITTDDSCMCSVTIVETPAFESLPSRNAVLSLKVGAFDPATFSDSTVSYSLKDSSDGVEVYVLSESGIIGETSTIFKVVDEYGKTVFFKNMISSITLGNTYSLRNPPSFMNLVQVELRDAEYEVDEFLVHLIRYRSSAPFISKKLIQYHGISNPSPGYVQRVSQAFISGSFSRGGVIFGNNEYGNLKAVAAAITLDPESLAPVVDADPVSGNIREPLLKMMQILRSLSFQRSPYVKFRHGLFDNLSYKIGQVVFDPPDQFSFFAHDYQPPGVFAETGLVAPESELMSMSSIVGLANGLISLVDYGLAHVDDGFGPPLGIPAPEIGDHSTAVGVLAFPYQTNDVSGVSNKIDELSTMITAGRLSLENKQVLLDAHAYFRTNYGNDFADKVLLKLMFVTPEFHTSNIVRKTGSPRSITPPAAKSSSPYKAIVYISLSGGADSFNILTPGASDCVALYEEYMEARGEGHSNIGLKADEILPIDGSSAGIRGCNTFGVNKLMSAYKDIFDEGAGIFFANMGHLHKPVTKADWLRETRTDLFSHSTMKAESHMVDAFREGNGPGVLGRMLDILEGHGHAVGANAINARVNMIDGSPKTGRLADVFPADGILKIRDRKFLMQESQQLRPFLESLHAETAESSGVFGNAWSQAFVDIWNKTDALAATYRRVQLVTSFPIPSNLNVGGITSQLKQIAMLIRARNERGKGINRDVFYCEMGGYDAHFQVSQVMENKLPSLNHAVATFWAEIKAQGLASNVVVVQGSEFGRTMTPNSNFGSDHGWGGNYFMFGGDVKGKKIMGKYPSFGLSDPTNIGRGRVMPTTSWDALFHSLTQWMGINAQDQIDYVLPNAQNFGCDLFTDYDLFKSGTQFLNGCGGITHETPMTFRLPEPRFLTGEEQKEVCRLATLTVSRRYDFDRILSRCYVGDQTVSESVSAPGFYDVASSAVFNFDGNGGISDSVVGGISDVNNVQAVATVTATIAAEKIVAGSIKFTEEPSSSPSSAPSFSPSISSHPTISPPTTSPTISSKPTELTSTSLSPTRSHAPSTSFEPTPGPTDRKTYTKQTFRSLDIGRIAFAGQSFEGRRALQSSQPGLYTILSSGTQIFGYSDSFHYMYIESSGDAAFTLLVEGLQSNETWAKGGIMFRSELSSRSSHYSIFTTKGSGLAQQYRQCPGCNTNHFGTQQQYPSVWLKVEKQGNVLKAYYKPASLAKDDPWIQFGYQLSMNDISSNYYYVGVAATAVTGMATLRVSNIQMTRTCSSKTITQEQCDQASNCVSGPASGSCYELGKVPSWELLEPVATIFDIGSTVASFGCKNANTDNYAFDKTTNKFVCDRTNLNEAVGLVVKPFHHRSSIAQGLRVYSNNDCPLCDPVSYKLEGRLNSIGSWLQISQGDLSWKNTSNFPRNSVLGVGISSTYTSGDNSRQFTEVSFFSHDFEECGSPSLQSDYRGTINSTISGKPCQLWSNETNVLYPTSGLGNHSYCRNPNNQPGGAWCYTVQVDDLWEYCNVPICEDDPATLKEYVEYKITWTALRQSNQLSLQLSEIEMPGLLGDEILMQNLTYEGQYVPSVIDVGADIKLLAGYSYGASWNRKAFDFSTQKFEMFRDNLTVTPGFIVSPSHGWMTVVTGLRIFSANNNPGADPIKYRISGSIMSGANVKNTVDNLCWRVSDNGILLGNADCTINDPHQMFFMNELGEIRVKSHPGWCLDHTFAVRNSYESKTAMFVPCFSEDTYNTDNAVIHQYTLNASSGQFESPSNVWTQSLLVPATKSCLSYNPNNSSGYLPGGIYPSVCSAELNQMFLCFGGQFTSSNSQNWTVISEGNLPWLSEQNRNPVGIKMSSTYETGDPSKYSMQVRFLNNSKSYYEYKIEFPEMRDSESTTVQFAELELPGLLLKEMATSSPTQMPTGKPTRKPTRTPTTKPTQKPTVTNNDGALVINKINRCGTSEINARENCRQTCDGKTKCPSGLSCFGVHQNYCGSIPQRIYSSPKISTVTHRCGSSEIFARTFCSVPCTSDDQCSQAGETCLAMNPNYCGSYYTEVGAKFETWKNMAGISSIADFVTKTNNFAAPPDQTVTLTTLLEIPTNTPQENYGVRVSGKLVPPVTGTYTFWIASDEKGEFWLSTNDQRSNKVRVGYHTSKTGSRQWDKYPTQQSAPIALVAGSQYYYEALMIEITGSDNLAVAWQYSGQSRDVIPVLYSRLPFTTSPTDSLTSTPSNTSLKAPTRAPTKAPTTVTCGQVRQPCSASGYMSCCNGLRCGTGKYAGICI